MTKKKDNINTVTVFRSWVDVIDTLPDTQKGRLYSAIMRYALDGTEPHLEPTLKALFELMRASIDISRKRKKAIAARWETDGTTDNTTDDTTDDTDSDTNADTNADANAIQTGTARAYRNRKGKGERDTAPAPVCAYADADRPDSPEAVAEIAGKQGVRMSEESAQNYWTDRVRKDWTLPGQRKPMSASAIRADIKRWALSDQSDERGRAAQVGDINDQIRKMQGS